MHAIALSSEYAAPNNGNVEHYLAMDDICNTGNVLKAEAVPVLPEGESSVSGEFIFINSDNKATTRFPIDTSQSVTVYANNTPISSSDYSVDYNTITFTAIVSGAQYTIDYVPSFISGYSLYAINAAQLNDVVDEFAAHNGTYDGANSTISFFLSYLPNAISLTVVRTFNGIDTPVNPGDITLNARSLTIANHDDSIPEYRNAIYMISYTTSVPTMNDTDLYYFGPNNSIVISSDARALLNNYSQTLIAPFVVMYNQLGTPDVIDVKKIIVKIDKVSTNG